MVCSKNPNRKTVPRLEQEIEYTNNAPETKMIGELLHTRSANLNYEKRIVILESHLRIATVINNLYCLLPVGLCIF